MVFLHPLAATTEFKRKDGSFLCVGDRVESDGYFATVKYIGTVPPTKGLLMVETAHCVLNLKLSSRTVCSSIYNSLFSVLALTDI